MGMNMHYAAPADLPAVIPLFPLSGVVLLPRAQLPLNIFEPRYLAMVDDALKSHRLIGMIQPQDGLRPAPPSQTPALQKIGCVGRITQFAESGDGRYLLTLTGVARFHVTQEMPVATPYRQAQADFSGFPEDFMARGEEPGGVDRKALVTALKDFVAAHKLRIDWKEVDSASDEMLVNALTMMCPFGPMEKQALLEAADLKTRADVLIAIAQMESGGSGGAPQSLQ